jgi:hypothetical protein
MSIVRACSTLLAVMALLATAGCADDATTAPGDTLQPTLSSIQTKIFTPKCAVSGCHVAGTAAHGLDLSAGQSFATLVGVASGEIPTMKRVNATKADSSYLMIKLEGDTTRMAAGTARMPLNGPALSAAEIAAVRQWIQNGAQNN